MTTLQRIPLQQETTDQVLSVELGGNPYNLRVLWNERFGYFSLSVLTSDNEPILTNVKMVKNYPLISRFKNTLLPRGEIYFVQEKGNSDRPGYSELEKNYSLVYFEPDQILEAEQFLSRVISDEIGSIWDSGLSVWDDGQSLWDQ